MKIYKLTQPQKSIGIALFIMAACVSFLLALSVKEPSPQIVAGENNQVSREVKLQLAVDNTEPLSVAAAPVQQEIKTPSNVNSAQQLPALNSWEMGGIKASTPKIPLSEKISAYTIVELEQHPASFPTVGQQITLPMLNGQKVTATVQSVTTSPNGDYTWSGHLDGYGSDYPVVMTYGEHSIFATITTPEGSYSMESLDGVGWLYKNPAEIELSTPSAKDFLEVNAIQ